MKERPILFSGEMVRAILDGRKTQTRRLVRLPPGYEHGEVYGYEGSHNGRHCLACDPGPSRAILCPYGAPGDRLWVRETFQQFYADEMPKERFKGPRGTMGSPATPGRASHVYYRADGNAKHPTLGCARWMPSIHMPRWASRLTLEVVSVRVERLQDISEAEALAEGIQDGGCNNCGESSHPNPCGCANPEPLYVDAFAWLWNSINGKRAPWVLNPWVWVVTFKTL